MPIWIIVAALASVGVTLILTSILWRANASSQVGGPSRTAAAAADGSDFGDPAGPAAGSGHHNGGSDSGALGEAGNGSD